MKKNPIYKIFPIACLLGVVALGCSKKKEVAVETPVSTEPAAVAPAAPAPAAAPINIAPSTDIGKSFAEADASIKARAYDKAAQALIAAQMQKNLSDQQAQEARNRMIGLQQNLAAAIAAGDANAKAAADMIRKAHTAR